MPPTEKTPLGGGTPNGATFPKKNSYTIALKKGNFVPGARLIVNVIPTFFNTFCPWAVFVAVTGCLTSRFHHLRPGWAYFVVLLFLAPAFLFGYLARYAKLTRDPNPNWYKFGTISCLLAHILGCIIGHAIFTQHMDPYYQIQDMKFYPLLDVTTEIGQNRMDAGRAVFAVGTHLDLSRSWHFTHGDIYCVAPIVGLQPSTRGSTDFWAVGKNCCGTSSADFRCGAYDNPQARAGLRSFDLEASPFYRLAVKQADAVHNIFSAHPLFFHWMEDPYWEMEKMATDGWNNYLIACFSYFAFCLLCTVMAIYKFVWIGRVKPPVGPDDDRIILA